MSLDLLRIQLQLRDDVYMLYQGTDFKFRLLDCFVISGISLYRGSFSVPYILL